MGPFHKNTSVLRCDTQLQTLILTLKCLFIYFYFAIFSTAVTQQHSTITVKIGQKVTLPCVNRKDFQDNCQSITWSFSVSGNTASWPMFGDEMERKITRAKFDRQSLSANCSVVIKKVTYEDVGRYTCRQFRSGQEVTHSLVDLFVITGEFCVIRF